MKKIILLLMALLVVSNMGFASNNAKIDNHQTISPQVKSISIDLGDITNMTTCELTPLISGIIESGLPDLPVLECSVTVTAEMTIGIAKISISVTVSGECSEIRQAGAEIARRVIGAIKAELTKFLE